MKENKFRLLGIGIGALGLMVATVAFAATAASVPEQATIDGCKAKKNAVAFPHAKHVKDLGLACDSCHHTNKALKAGDATEVAKCGSCHLKPEKAETPVCTSPSPKTNPFHAKCMTCHKEKAEKDPAKKDLAKCTTCHK